MLILALLTSQKACKKDTEFGVGKLQVKGQVYFSELQSRAEHTFPRLYNDDNNSYLMVFIWVNQDY